jgi:hypothetical protein
MGKYGEKETLDHDHGGYKASLSQATFLHVYPEQTHPSPVRLIKYFIEKTIRKQRDQSRFLELCSKKEP